MPSQKYTNPLTGRIFSPRLNVPTEFFQAMSYEDQILLLLHMLADAIERGDLETITNLRAAIQEAADAAQTASDKADKVGEDLAAYKESNDAALATTNGNVSALTERVATAEGNIGTLQTDVAGIQEKIVELEGKPYYVVDSTMSQADINTALGIHRCVIFMPGTYNVSIPASDAEAWYGYRFQSDSDTIMLGAVFQCGQVNKDRSYPILINVSEDVRIRGDWEIIGDASLRPSPNPAGNTMQAGLYISSSHNVVIDGLTVHNMFGDGIAIDGSGADSECTNVLIQNCECYDCHRNGASIMNVRECSVINSSFHDCTGADPANGIDVEPYQWGVQVIQNLRLMGCDFYNNRGGGLSLVNQDNTVPYTCYVSDCTIDGMIIQAFGDQSLMLMDNCVIDAGSKVAVNCIPLNGNNCRFSDCVFKTTDAVMYSGYNDGSVEFPRMSNCKIIGANNIYYYERYGNTAYIAYFDNLQIPSTIVQPVRLQTGGYDGYISGTLEKTSTQVQEYNGTHNVSQAVVVVNTTDTNLSLANDVCWSVPILVINNSSNALTLTGGTFHMDGASGATATVPAYSSKTVMYHPTVGAFIEV